jgi:regulator of nonsense transcripts 1
MIQFSKPRRALVKPMDAFRRHEVNAKDLLGGSNGFIGSNDGRQSGVPSRFDASFYRTHDPLGYIPSDVQSLKSQETYSSGLPMFTSMSGPYAQNIPRANNGKRSAYGSYASSVISQDAGGATDNSSFAALSERNSTVAYSQSDRLHRRLSYTSSVAGTSDLGSLISGSQYDYKSQVDDSGDMDDMKSQYAPTTSGITSF